MEIPKKTKKQSPGAAGADARNLASGA